eukprot:CAMPEP_0113697418 /NCGR_PEP_ID=MMETSP0038_2-20120614/22123_1 /TAXON_ID=2898 /ORGANISM="Cryptomonas paramecium" /LENGTH=164 /DNA_ID=CAMNT_0000620427 /DNA_START=156 /DNA_END=652 /DNA_ORIENTATION=- /assembly_acc=CAM_ASM_000170
MSPAFTPADAGTGGCRTEQRPAQEVRPGQGGLPHPPEEEGGGNDKAEMALNAVLRRDIASVDGWKDHRQGHGRLLPAASATAAAEEEDDSLPRAEAPGQRGMPRRRHPCLSAVMEMPRASAASASDMGASDATSSAVRVTGAEGDVRYLKASAAWTGLDGLRRG